jgi:hypothetical protein
MNKEEWLQMKSTSSSLFLPLRIIHAVDRKENSVNAGHQNCSKQIPSTELSINLTQRNEFKSTHHVKRCQWSVKIDSFKVVCHQGSNQE